MSADAIAAIDSEIQAMQSQQDVLRAQVGALDAPIAALVRVKRTLMGDSTSGNADSPRVSAKADDEPLVFPGTEIPARTPQDRAEVLAAIERLEADGR